uniref:vesicle transport v-SNARE 13-like n=1 Tax=Erigeron canadensis TaxID=72917 RepID=UPI001CB92C9C|nr:vesicle transport v-SNARE 13-like [Erigeron canadensis]
MEKLFFIFKTFSYFDNKQTPCISEEKKKRVSEIAGEMKEVEALMHKMDLETRSVQPSMKATLREKICKHGNDLSNLKTELKRLGSSNTNQARAELLGSGGSNTIQGSAALGGRLATSTKNLKRSIQRIKVSTRNLLETGHKPLQLANTTLHGVKDNAEGATKI